eukprot:GDKJ01063007.1.p1 GENE.GDKJ01063007.1~~GDKJ01063007.1.p1  ORF type:complete len:266 (+),score=60.76 GDKJ01063007.1:29-799(+)
MKFLTQHLAKHIDEVLMSEIIGYSLQQLMELAGLAVAKAVSKEFNSSYNRVVLIVGPGNNGGDALVAARHLASWQFNVHVVIPEPCRTEVNVRLKELLEVFGVTITDSLPDLTSQDFVVDGIFGFSFTRSPRAPYDSIIRTLIDVQNDVTILSIDIPSGWDVEQGPKEPVFLMPAIVLSLTAPKKCMHPDILSKKNCAPKKHYVGGRFMPLLPRASDSPQLAAIKASVRDALTLPDGTQIWEQWGSESIFEFPHSS